MLEFVLWFSRAIIKQLKYEFILYGKWDEAFSFFFFSSFLVHGGNPNPQMMARWQFSAHEHVPF